MIVNRATEKNLEKIEELFLHLIDLKQKCQNLEKRLSALE